VKYKIIVTIFYILSTEPNFDKLSNEIWSVLFIINKYDFFFTQIQNIKNLNLSNIKILENFDQIDEEIDAWIEKQKHLALVIWDHKEKKEITRQFAEELRKNINRINRKIDILCLDFCYSANFEIIINMMSNVDFIIANQDRQFMDGFCYKILFEATSKQTNQVLSCQELVQEIVLQTCNKYINTDQFNLINIVAVNCKKIKLLLPFINKLDKLKSNSTDLFNLIEKQFYCRHLAQFLINNIIVAQAKTGNYQLSSGISI
jgi:hypothetical protein